MEIIIQPSAETGSAVAARIVARQLREKPDSVIGLATGSTPLLLYRELIRLHRDEHLDLSRVTTFNLDEYVGLRLDHPQSYHALMWENLFRHVNIPKEQVHIPDGMARDIPAFCKQYESKIAAAGGVDLQVLGIGSGGHIGFNEPTSSLASGTRIKTLTEETRNDNARYFGSIDQVPYHVITMGIGTIMRSRQCLLLAFGKNKAPAIAAAVEGSISAMNPASVLQMHPIATVVLDEPAASQLKKAIIIAGYTSENPSGSGFKSTRRLTHATVVFSIANLALVRAGSSVGRATAF